MGRVWSWLRVVLRLMWVKLFICHKNTPFAQNPLRCFELLLDLGRASAHIHQASGGGPVDFLIRSVDFKTTCLGWSSPSSSSASMYCTSNSTALLPI